MKKALPEKGVFVIIGKTVRLTPRLQIRAYLPEDADAVWQVLRRPEIYATTAFIPKDYPRDRVDWWIRYIANNAKNHTGYEFGMFERGTGRYIGNTGIINLSRDNQSASISYFIDPDCWNRGYATEGGAAMLQFAFDSLCLHRVGGSCMSKNPASRRVMERLGFHFVGTVPDELRKDDSFVDVDHLSILYKDWLNIQKGQIST